MGRDSALRRRRTKAGQRGRNATISGWRLTRHRDDHLAVIGESADERN